MMDRKISASPSHQASDPPSNSGVHIVIVEKILESWVYTTVCCCFDVNAENPNCQEREKIFKCERAGNQVFLSSHFPRVIFLSRFSIIVIITSVQLINSSEPDCNANLDRYSK